MDLKSKRSSPMTEEKKKIMVEFIKKHPILQTRRLSNGVCYKDMTRLWCELTDILSSVPGPRKEWKDWRKTWHGMRTRAKAKRSRNNTIMKGTGGGIPVSEVLTPIEADVAEFISPICSFGIREIPESQVTEIVEEMVSGDSVEKSKSYEATHIPEFSSITPVKIKNTTLFSGRSGKISATKRLQTSISAVQDINSTIKERSSWQQEYYKKKIELLQQQINIQDSVIE